eukprot:438427_1
MADNWNQWLKDNKLEKSKKNLKDNGITDVNTLLHKLTNDTVATQFASDKLKLGAFKTTKFRNAVAKLREACATANNSTDSMDDMKYDNQQNKDKIRKLSQQIDSVNKVIHSKEQQINQQFKQLSDALKRKQNELLSELQKLKTYSTHTLQQKISLLQTTQIQLDVVDSPHINVLFDKQKAQNILNDIKHFGTITNNISYGEQTLPYDETVDISSTNEIVTIAVGECGNNLSNMFWNILNDEHKGGQKPTVFYESKSEYKYKPRAIAIDLDPNTNVSNLIPSNNIFLGNKSSQMNAELAYDGTKSKKLMESAWDGIRKMAEKCNHMQGVQVFHSLGGGTGSGLTSRICTNIRDNYVRTPILTYSIFPSQKISNHEYEAFNTMVGMHHLLDYADICYLMDNEALFTISNTLNMKNPQIKHLNKICGSVINDLTSIYRYKTRINWTIGRLVASLVPLPRLHFLSVSHAPIFINQKHQNVAKDGSISLRSLIMELNGDSSEGNLRCKLNRIEGERNENKMKKKNKEYHAKYNSDDGICFSSLLVYRGRGSMKMKCDPYSLYQDDNCGSFANYFEHINEPSIFIPKSATMVQNTSKIIDTIKPIHWLAQSQYEKKTDDDDDDETHSPFVTRYMTKAGRAKDHMVVAEAVEDIRYLLCEYMNKFTNDEDDEDDEDDEHDEEEEEDEEDDEDYDDF